MVLWDKGVEAAIRTAMLALSLSDDLGLESLPDALLSKIIDCMTTTEGRGLLLCCRRLSDLARPNVFQKRQREVRIFVFWSSEPHNSCLDAM